MLFFDNGNFVYTTNDKDIAYYALLSELRLFLEENEMDIEAGIDYKAILNGEKFLKTELNRVCEKHKDNFNSYEVQEPTQNGETISCNIILSNLDNTTQNINIIL